MKTWHKAQNRKGRPYIWYATCSELHCRLQNDCTVFLASCLAAGKHDETCWGGGQLQKTYRSHKPLLPLHLLPGWLKGSKIRGFGHLAQTSHQGYQVTKERAMRSRSYEFAHLHLDDSQCGDLYISQGQGQGQGPGRGRGQLYLEQEQDSTM